MGVLPPENFTVLAFPPWVDVFVCFVFFGGRGGICLRDDHRITRDLLPRWSVRLVVVAGTLDWRNARFVDCAGNSVAYMCVMAQPPNPPFRSV